MNIKKWKYFTIDRKHYLAVANFGVEGRPEMSRVYKWDNRKKKFINFQG